MYGSQNVMMSLGFASGRSRGRSSRMSTRLCRPRQEGETGLLQIQPPAGGWSLARAPRR
jgi:hypothetical protein